MGKLEPETQRKIEGKIISYYHHGYQSFVFLGCTLENPRFNVKGQKLFDPDKISGCENALGPNKGIKIQDLLPSPSDPTLNGAEAFHMQHFQDDADNCLTFKVRDRAKFEQIKPVQGSPEPQPLAKGSRRTKERKIGEVIQKVQRWRDLYYHNCQSLEEAAKKVGISKKSLDDYFLQLKNGKVNGFNFNEHKNDKIGILRNWNKHHKESKNANKL